MEAVPSTRRLTDRKSPGGDAPSDTERYEIDGRSGRRVKITRYAGGWCVDLGIVFPGRKQAKAMLTLDVNGLRELSALLDDLADVAELAREAWAEQQAVSA